MSLEDRMIRKAQTGDEKALAWLYETHVKTLFKFILYKVSTREIAEDITAEAFIKAFEKLDSFKFKSSFKTWLYAIAKNLLFNHYNHKSKEFDGVTDEEIEYYNTDNQPELSSKDYDLIEKEVKNILKNLKDNYKQVLELRFILNFSLKDTAKIMNLTTSNVKVLQHRAIKKAKEITNE